MISTQNKPYIWTSQFFCYLLTKILILKRLFRGKGKHFSENLIKSDVFEFFANKSTKG